MHFEHDNFLFFKSATVHAFKDKIKSLFLPTDF